MKTYGITGGIASGKSAVCRFLEDDYPIIDADLVSREVVAPGQPGLARIREVFGPEVITAAGTLDRSRLRHMIAASKQDQQKLNGILHPLIIATIRQRLEALVAKGEPVAFVSAALMLETGSYKHYDGVILVTAPAEIRLERLLRRDGMEEQAARNLMAKQMPDEEKRRLAEVEIVNDQDLDTLKQRTMAALRKLAIVS